jgi:hypothetical protein
MDFGSALFALTAAFLVKGAVMVLGGWLLLRLYGAAWRRPPARAWLLLPAESLPEVRLLWWALALFAASELTCGVEIYVLFQSSAILSGAHAVTSAAGMALFALGLYLFADRRLLRFGGPPCLANRICRGCTIAQGCRFRVVILLLATFLALAVAVPLFAPAERMNADTSRYVLPFPALNAWYDSSVVPWLEANVPGYRRSGVAYYLPRSVLFIEFRVLPALALAGAVASVGLALRRREAAALKVAAAAAGGLCYSYFELVIYRGTGDVLLGSLMHEVAEFWFLVFTAELLRRCFPAGTAAVADQLR